MADTTTHVLDSGIAPTYFYPPPPPPSVFTPHFTNYYVPYPNIPEPSQLTMDLQALFSSQPSLECLDTKALEALLEEGTGVDGVEEESALQCPEVGELADLSLSSSSSMEVTTSEVFPHSVEGLEVEVESKMESSEDLLERLTNEIFENTYNNSDDIFNPLRTVSPTPLTQQASAMDLEQLLCMQPPPLPEIPVPYVPTAPSIHMKGVQGNCRVTYSKNKIQPRVTRPKPRPDLTPQSEGSRSVQGKTLGRRGPERLPFHKSINASVFKEIKEQNSESDSDFTGYTVFHPESISTLLPLTLPPPKKPCRECGVNRGRVTALSSADETRTRVKTDAGAEIMIISPRPRYRIMPTPSKRKIRTIQGLTCFKCDKDFRSSKLLATHIIKVHQNPISRPVPM
eukprot:sb/3465400/